jgi:hypothetical protein
MPAGHLDLGAPPVFVISGDSSSVAERWKKWKQAFGFYIVATGVTAANQKKAVLLHVAGPEVQEVFGTLGLPDTATVEQVLDCLDGYFAPKRNFRYERFVFRQIEQGPAETVDAFVTRLKKAASTCDFTDVEDVIIDQVISRCFPRDCVGSSCRRWI